jgi:predicted RND superfamily exporter protein
VRACLLEVGRPIVMTSLMLMLGFLVVLASGFATLREFGYLTAVTMAICLAADLLLLPALLARARV